MQKKWPRKGGGNECSIGGAPWFGDPEYELDAMTVRTILQDKDYLISTIRPYLDKGLTGVPSWLVPRTWSRYWGLVLLRLR